MTKRIDSFRMFTRLLSVLVGSLLCGGGYGNWKAEE